MYKRILSMIFALSLCQLLHAQAPDDTTGMIVHTNNRLDEIMKKQFTGATVSKSTSAPSNSKTVKLLNYKVKRQGFRILVLNTNDRELTYKTKGQLLGRYPDQQLYTVYQAPFFKLKMGDFISRNEAEKYRTELSKIFPKGVFILRETVWVKPDDQPKM